MEEEEEEGKKKRRRRREERGEERKEKKARKGLEGGWVSGLGNLQLEKALVGGWGLGSGQLRPWGCGIDSSPAWPEKVLWGMCGWWWGGGVGLGRVWGLRFRTPVARVGPGGLRIRPGTPAGSPGPEWARSHLPHSPLILQSPEGLSPSPPIPAPCVSLSDHGNSSPPPAAPQGC